MVTGQLDVRHLDLPDVDQELENYAVSQLLLADHTELYKQFSDNASFKKWLGDAIFDATYQQHGASFTRG